MVHENSLLFLKKPPLYPKNQVNSTHPYILFH